MSHLSGLVEDLLEIARLDNGSATPDLRWVDVGALAADVAVAAPRHAHRIVASRAARWSTRAGWSGCSRT